MSGLKDLLTKDTNSRFTLLTMDNHTMSLAPFCLRQFYAAHSDPSKYKLHVVSMTHEQSPLVDHIESVQHYNFKRPSTSKHYSRLPVDLLEVLTDNYNPEPNTSLRSILVLDDLQVFFCYANQDVDRFRGFFNHLRLTSWQVVSLVNSDSAPPSAYRLFCSLADSIARLDPAQGDRFACSVLVSKSSGKLDVKESMFTIENGDIIEYLKPVESTDTEPRSNTPKDPGFLTTFKIKLEENEQEDRNRVYLPYFNAQSNVQVTQQLFDDEEEEDEEI